MDYYYASGLLQQSDSDILQTTLTALRRACPEALSSLSSSDIEDSVILRLGRAVTHFAPGTFKDLPPIKAPSLENFFFCGDWVDRAGHRSWSQEKALVTGYQAALGAAEELSRSSSAIRRALPLIPRPLDVEPDEPHVAAGRRLAKLSPF